MSDRHIATVAHYGRGEGRSTRLRAVTRQAQQHQRRLLFLVLSQVHLRAAALRAQSARAPSEEDEPLSLVELIEASNQVLARFDIRPPLDAVYHRHLLALAIDPDLDWRAKIERYVQQQPTTQPPHVPQRRTPSAIPKRQPSASARAKENLVRRASISSAVGFETPERARKTARGATTPATVDLTTTLDDDSMWTPPRGAHWIDGTPPRRTKPSAVSPTLPPMCTRALFKWIVLALEERHVYQTSCDALPTHILRRVAMIPTEHLALLRACTHQLLRWTARQILTHWATDSQRKRRFRAARQQRVKQWTQDVACQCLHAWIYFTLESRCVQQRGRWLARHTQRTTALAYFRHWHQSFRMTQQLQHAHTYWQRKCVRAVWLQWRAWHVKQRLAREWSRRRVCRHALQQWRLYQARKQLTQQQRVVAYRLAAVQLVREHWRHWRLVALQQRQVHMQSALWTQQRHARQRAHVFAVWKSWTQHTVATKVRLLRLSAVQRMRRLRACLEGWRVVAERRCSIRLLLLDRAVIADVERLHRAWDGWIDFHHARRDLLGRHTVTLQHAKKTRIWSGWKSATRMHRCAAIMRYAYNRHVMVEAGFRPWVAVVQHQRVHQEQLDRITRRRTTRVVNAAFQALAANVAARESVLGHVDRMIRRRVRARIARVFMLWALRTEIRARIQALGRVVVARADTCTMQRQWQHWRHVFHLAMIWRQATQVDERRQCTIAFEGWKTLAAQQRRVHRIQEAVRRRRKTMQLNRGVQCWKSMVKRAQRTQQAALATRVRRNDSALHQCWSQWRHQFRKANTHRAKLARALVEWHRRQLQVVLHAWIALVRENQKQAQLVKRALADHDFRVLGRVWQQWTQRWHHQRAKRLGVQEARRFHDRFRLHGAVQRWNERHTQAAEARANTAIARRHGHGTRVKRSLVAWRNGVLVRKHQRERQHMATRHRRITMHSKLFRAWGCWLHQRRQWQQQTEKASVALVRKRTQQAVRALHSSMLIAKQQRHIHRSVALVCLRNATARCFIRWKAMVALHLAEKARTIGRQQHMNKYRQGQALVRWETHTRHCRDARAMVLEAVACYHTTLTRRVVSAWMRRIQRRAAKRQEEDKADRFRIEWVMPTHFGAWCRWMDSRKQTEKNITKAIIHWHERRQHRAVLRWGSRAKASQQRRQARYHLRRRRLLTTWHNWRHVTEQRRAKHAKQALADAFCAHQQLFWAFIGWHRNAKHAKVIRHFRTLWVVRATTRCFSHWFEVAQQQRIARRMLMRLKHALLVRVLNSWRSVIQRRRVTADEIQARFLQLWRATTAHQCFQRWVRWTMQQRTLAQCLSVRRQRIFCVCLDAWRQRVTRQVQEHERAANVVDRARATTLRVWWWEWRWRLDVHCAVHALARRVQAQRDRALVLQVWHSWWSRAHTLVAVKARSRLKRLRVQRQCFQGWINARQARRTCRAIGQHVEQLHKLFIFRWLHARATRRLKVRRICEHVLRPRQLRKLVLGVWEAWQRFHRSQRRQREAQAQLQHLFVRDQRAFLLVRECVRRWKHGRLLRIVEHWQCIAFSLQQQRQRTIQALTHWQSTHSRHFFRCWLRWRNQRRHQLLVADRGDAHRLRRTWRRWCRYVHYAIGNRSAIESAEASHRVRRLKMAILCWTSFATGRAAQSEIVTMCDHQRRQRTLRRIVNAWKARSLARRMKKAQHAVARVHFCAQALQNAMAQWKNHVTLVRCHRLQLRQSTERLQVLLLCSMFRAWLMWTQRQRGNRQLVSEFRVVADQRTRNATFQAWRTVVAHIRQTKTAAMAFAYVHSIRRALRRLSCHAKVVKADRAKKKEERQALTAVTLQQLRQGFDQWRSYAGDRSLAKGATQHYVWRQLLPRCFRSWKNFVNQRRHRAVQNARAISTARKSLLRHAWDDWHMYHVRSCLGELAMQRAVNHHEATQLHLAVRRWRCHVLQAARYTESCRRILYRWRLRTVCACLERWRRYTETRLAVQEAASVVAAHSQQLSRLRAWMTWRLMFQAQSTGRRKCLQRVWRRWLLRINERVYKRELVAQGQRHATTWVLQRGVYCWKRTAMAACAMRMMSELAQRFHAQRRLTTTSQRWQTWAHQRRGHRERVKKAQQHDRRRVQSRFLACWCLYVNQRLAKKALLERADAYVHERGARCGVKTWHVRAGIRKKQRTHFTVCLEAIHAARQRRCLLAWQRVARYRRQLRRQVLTAWTKRSQEHLRVIIFAWRQRVTRSRSKAAATQRWSVKQQCLVLVRWRQYVLLTKVERMIGVSDRRNTERCLVAWRKITAVRRRLRGIRAKIDSRVLLLQAHECFRAWRQWTSTSIHGRAVLAATAAAFRLRIRFGLWVRFVAVRQRLRAMTTGQDVVVVHEPTTTTMLSSAGAMVICGENDGNENASGTATEMPVMQALSYEAMHRALSQKRVLLQRFVFDGALGNVWQRWRLLFHAVLFHRLRTQQRVFVAWRSRSRLWKRVRMFTARQQRRTRARVALTICRAWQELVQGVRQYQQQCLRDREVWAIANRELLRRDKRRLRQHWEAWIVYMEEKRHLAESLALYQRARVQTKYWLLWRHDFLGLVRKQRLASMRCSERMTQWRQRASIRRWRDRTLVLKTMRLVVRHLLERQEERVVATVLLRWREWTTCQRHVRRLVLAHVQLSLLSFFQRWHRWTSQQRQRRRRVLGYLSQRSQFQLASTWQRWRQFLITRRQNEQDEWTAVCFRVRRLLRYRWLSRANARSVLQLRTQTAYSVLALRKQARAVRRWRMNCQHRVEARRVREMLLRKCLEAWKRHAHAMVADRFLQLCRRLHAKNVLLYWHDIAKKQACWRALCDNHQRNRGCVVQIQCLKAWKQWTSTQWRHRCALAVAREARRRRVWKCWQAVTLLSARESSRQRAIADAHVDAARQRTAWQRWQAAVSHSRKRAFVLRSCMHKLTSYYWSHSLQISWQGWNQIVALRRTVIKVQQQRTARQQRSMLAHWHAIATACAFRHRQLEEARRYQRQRRLAAVFFYWQSYFLAWKQAERCRQSHEHGGRKLSVSGDDGVEEDQPRPLSPVMKRLQTRAVVLTDGSGESTAPMISLPEVAELSLDVKKRLLLLGRWKPTQSPLSAK